MLSKSIKSMFRILGGPLPLDNFNIEIIGKELLAKVLRRTRDALADCAHPLRKAELMRLASTVGALMDRRIGWTSDQR